MPFKKIFKYLIVIVAVYSIAWLGLANYFKNKIENSLLPNMKKLEIAEISYDKSSITGYPFRVGIKFHDPEITLRLGKLIHLGLTRNGTIEPTNEKYNCLLYTSDAADES